MALANRVVKAVDAFRRGMPVLIAGKGRTATMALAVETADDKALKSLKPTKARPAYQLLTHARARTLKFAFIRPT